MAVPSSERVTLFVCNTCRRGDEPFEPAEQRSGMRLVAALTDALRQRDQDPKVDLVQVACLSVCKRGCGVAFASPSKWTIVVGDLDPALNAGDILSFAELYRQSAEGRIPKPERPEPMRTGVIARVPPFPAKEEA